MSFHEYSNKTIQPGDIVILYQGPDNLDYIKVSDDAKAIHSCRLGHFKHKDMIGLHFGSKIESADKKTYLHGLHPTPELWTKVLPHRTQIIYNPDISLITTYLNVKPGSVVIEAGTGSGSFSHSFARTLAPNGKLYTFDFHQQRVEAARKEFIEHQLGDLVEASHRDVCNDGFGLTDAANAVFLDLPMPWKAVPFAKIALKKDEVGRISCFSPCIEQVQKTVDALNAEGFQEIETVEILSKNYSVHSIQSAILTEKGPESRKSLNDSRDNKRKRAKTESEKEKEKVATSTSSAPTGEQTESRQPSIVTRSLKEMKGHTSFLTFAVLLPREMPSN